MVENALGAKGGSEMAGRSEVSAQFARSVPQELSALRQDSVNRDMK